MMTVMRESERRVGAVRSVPNEAGVVIPCRQGSKTEIIKAHNHRNFYKGELILDWAPHSDVVAVATQPRLAEDNSNQFLLLKHAHYCRKCSI
jgi:hypothetical protein